MICLWLSADQMTFKWHRREEVRVSDSHPIVTSWRGRQEQRERMSTRGFSLFNINDAQFGVNNFNAFPHYQLWLRTFDSQSSSPSLTLIDSFVTVWRSFRDESFLLSFMTKTRKSYERSHMCCSRSDWIRELKLNHKRNEINCWEFGTLVLLRSSAEINLF